MHDDDAVDVQRAMQRVEIGNRCRTWRVFSVRRQREFLVRPENVDVAVAGTFRHVERNRRLRYAENGND